MHVLIIEDRLDIAALIAEELRQDAGWSFDIVDGQDGALAAAEVQRPDLIVADHLINQGSGAVAVEILCRSGRIPTVFMSAEPMEKVRLPAHVICLRKPFGRAALVTAVEQAMSRAADGGPAATP